MQRKYIFKILIYKIIYNYCIISDIILESMKYETCILYSVNLSDISLLSQTVLILLRYQSDNYLQVNAYRFLGSPRNFGDKIYNPFRRF